MMGVALLLSRGIQSALEPAGIRADRIANLWNVFLVVTVIVYVLVMLFLVAALFRRRTLRTDETPPGTVTVIVVCIGITVLTLFGLLISSIFTGRAIASVPAHSMLVELTGKQWWWQVDYDHPDKSKRITSANEIYIPVGVPVAVHLHSSDVIHSFWVPALNGKRDLIPGHDSSIFIQADRAGVYRGQCAEFCGLQHARMAFWVTALPPAEFARWADAQRQPSAIPSTPKQREGFETFMNSPCPLCHNIQGTDASGKTGPDLTHFASRRSIAAGTLPNRRGYLAGWILDPQHFKPGSQMPPMIIEQGKLDPLLDYLESLR